MRLKVKKLHPDAKIPTKGTPGAGCYDIYSVEDTFLKVGDTKMVRTGIAMEIPEGWCAVIYSRSSMFLKNNVVQVPLVVDSDYRGEVMVMLHDSGHWSGSHYEPHRVKVGDRIAQFKLEKVEAIEFEEAENLSETKRGAGGYGSTGR